MTEAEISQVDRLYDQYHGCHYDEDNNVVTLSPKLGSTSYKMVEITEEVINMIEKGTYRIIYQHRDMEGMISKPAVISEETIDRSLARTILRIDDKVGSLNVYTPDKDDAKEVMRSANRPCFSKDPSDFILTVYLDGMQNERINGIGNMCFYGPILTQDFIVARINKLSDEKFGFHPTVGETYTFAEDLGGSEMKFDSTEFGLTVAVKDGDYHAIIDLTPHVPKGIVYKSLISVDPIPYDLVQLILTDDKRAGELSVFTPRREDALNAMTEAMGGKKPYETKDNKGLFIFKCRCFLRGKKDYRKPKIAYRE